MTTSTNYQGFLIPDSSTRIILEEIANEETCFPGAWARNVLISCNLLDFHEPILFESNYKSSGRKYSHFSKTIKQTPEFFIFPNPAKDFVIIETPTVLSTKPAMLVIYDMQGRHVGSIVLSMKSGQQVFSLHNIPTGTYIFRLLLDNTQSNTVKVVVLH